MQLRVAKTLRLDRFYGGQNVVAIVSGTAVALAHTAELLRQRQPAGAPAYEYRAFFVDGQVVGCWPRSDLARELGPPPAELMAQVAAKVPSPFASADFGADQSGRWWLLEVGDGQVSGLPEPEAARPVFAALADHVRLFGELRR